MAVRYWGLPDRLVGLCGHPRPVARRRRPRAAACACWGLRRSSASLRRLGRGCHMTALELLTDLRDRGVKLWVDGADLRFSARKGTLGKAAAEQLARHKTELVELLKSPSTGAARRDQDSARAKRV